MDIYRHYRRRSTFKVQPIAMFRRIQVRSNAQRRSLSRPSSASRRKSSCVASSRARAFGRRTRAVHRPDNSINLYRSFRGVTNGFLLFSGPTRAPPFGPVFACEYSRQPIPLVPGGSALDSEIRSTTTPPCQDGITIVRSCTGFASVARDRREKSC